MSNYDQFVRDHWGVHPKTGGDNLTPDLFIMATGLTGEAGEVMEHLKKFIRDGRLDKEALKLELGDVLFYLTRTAQWAGFSLEEIAQGNIDKLEARYGKR